MKKDVSNSFHAKMKGIFWILIGIVFVPPLSVLWLQPLGLYTSPPQTSSYLVGTLLIGILIMIKGSFEIRKERKVNDSR
tara:strand:- start:407 stop:643 length:237 start_codon:yes stop_codon:yes gene_type:complete